MLILSRMFFLFLCVFSFVATAAPRIELITKLPTLEVYEGHLFHDGILFVGRSRVTEQESHSVELYNKSGELLKKIPLKHSASYIHTFSADEAIVVGRAATPYWHTFYTRIQTKAPYRTLTHNFPEEIQVDKFAGSKGNAFFVLLGENQILHQTLSKSGPLPYEISGPGYMATAANNSLFVVENKTLYPGDENLVRIDLKTGKAERTFTSPRNYLTRIESLENGQTVAVSETDAEQVLLVDAATNKVKEIIPIESGSPRDMAELGKCLIVASEESRHISVYRLGATAERVALYDLSALGTIFRKARSVAADPRSGTIFARSTFLCSGCGETMSSVAKIEDPELLNLCH